MLPETFFRALSDPTRLRSLVLLDREGELCVCELTYALRVSQPKISRHLAYLRDAGVVADRRDGTWVHYRLRPDLPDWARAVIRAAADALAEESVYAEDAGVLARMPDRPAGRCCV